MITRRRILVLAGGGSFCNATSGLWAASGFWNRKPSTQWSPEEIQQLTTHSPWAKETNLDFEAAEGGHFQVPGSGSPYGGTDGQGRGATIERPAGTMKSAPVVVRWESAKPIRDALLIPLPREFEGHYVLSVSNVPPTAMNPEKRNSPDAQPVTLQQMTGELQAASTLQAAGKDAAGAGLVRRATGLESTYLFGFAKEFLTLTTADKEVVFLLRTNRVSVKAKFQPREMLYRGTLAL